MMKEFNRLNGSRSTKNLESASFMCPKKTVSINLYSNENNQRESIDSNASYCEIIAEVIRNQQNSSKFSTLKKPNHYSKKRASQNTTLTKEVKSFGKRKRTVESNSNLSVLSKQLEQTEATLNAVSRKHSLKLNNISDKIQVLKSRLESQKSQNYLSNSAVVSKTPNGQAKFKTKNMTKYLQSKSRNANELPKASKTLEKVSNRKSYKPYAALLKSFGRSAVNNMTTRRTMKKKIPNYIEKAYKEAIDSIGSSSPNRRDSCILSDQSDKTTQKKLKKSESSHIISLSDDADESEKTNSNPMDTQFYSREQLMNIQEEQEYTTNEKSLNQMDSSCH
jgi:hypothetical protein